jgi:hypothetical protein
VVAEDHIHPRVALLIAMDVVQLLGAITVQAATAIACEVVVDGATEHAFVGGHPLDSLLVGQREHFFGDAPLGRP